MPDYSQAIETVRAFNRFYMPAMKLLGSHYLGSEYAAAEARIFYEIYENEGCTAARIAGVMQLDKSYLSKVLAGHERDGFVRRVPSTEDRRAYHLYLTPRGRARAEAFIRKSNEEIGAILRDIPEEDLPRLTRALEEVMAILKQGGHENEGRTL